MFHWKTIYNEYIKWCKDDIFMIAYKHFINEHYFKLSKLKHNKQINLFIDVTKINNKYGSDGIGVNIEYKKKNVSSLTVICDENKIPLAFKCIENKNIYRKKKTHQHEIKNVQQTIDTISVDLDKVKINIIGDKGYVTKEKFRIGKKKISIITPVKKNQKKVNTIEELKLLKQKHKIENLFATLKNSERISIRKERNMKNYMGFICLGCLQYLFRYNETHLNADINLPK